MNATMFLMATLFAASGLVWRQLVSRATAGRPFLDQVDEPRARWRSAAELAVAYVALLWLIVHLIPQFSNAEKSEQTPVGVVAIVIVAAVNIGFSLILPLALASGGRAGSDFGFKTANLGNQLRVGVLYFIAAVIPMGISMFITLPLRSIQHQHSLLKLLGDSPDVTTISVIAVTAVLSAPMLEEVIFRVILQGWLTTLFPPAVSISLVAISFALVHGWRDGLALLPLAFILGYVFHRRHSYVAVVMIHALFNATMLIVQLMNPQVP
jgi:membrane protease YdiL (CAAX protease family)